MTANRLTFSRMEHAALCPGFVGLKWYDHVNAGSSKGTTWAKWHAEAMGRQGDFIGGAPESISRMVVGFDWDDAAQYYGADPESEVKIAWDPFSGEAVRLFTEGERDYSGAPEGWLAGTLDVLGTMPDGVVVCEQKTGWWPVSDPDKNLQLKAQACAAAAAYGVDQVQATLMRIGDDGAFYPAERLWDKSDLENFAGEIRHVLRESRKEEPRLVTGEHCRFCPAFASCPVKTGTLQAASLGEPTITEDNAPRVWDRLLAIEAIAKNVRLVLEDFARLQPFTLTSGAVVREHVKETEKLDPKIVKVILSEMDIVGEAPSTKTALKRVAGKQWKDVMDKVRSRDGIIIKHTSRVEAVEEK